MIRKVSPIHDGTKSTGARNNHALSPAAERQVSRGLLRHYSLDFHESFGGNFFELGDFLV